MGSPHRPPDAASAPGTRKFVLGIVQGAQFVRQNPESAEIALSYISGLELEDAIQGFPQSHYDPRVSVCTEEGVMTAAQSLIDDGLIEVDEPFEVEDLLKVDILNRVIEEHPEYFDDLPPIPESLDECLGDHPGEV
ncbi:MAG: hypothetical protein GEU81_14035 [Nitriliruptorales bacterium]|nr:hypothetical protein [Nitriliruptorales bacterium]